MSLDDLRSEIDEIDSQIVRLLGSRAGVVEHIREEKAQSDTPAYDPRRETELLRRICAMGAHPLPEDSLRAVYQEIISACRALQVLRVAYLGPEFTNTFLAARKQFGASTDLHACRTIEKIFDLVERGEAQVGIVPIENSLNGIVGETCDCLLETPLRVCAETYLPIHHAIMARCSLQAIKIVYSHPQVFAQSRDWLRDNLADAELVAMPSTAAAAREAAAQDGTAAIAPSIAAEPYDLTVLARNIEDRPDNRTRFFVLAEQSAPATGRDKTSLAFSSAHRAGSLHDALGPLHENGINMTLIQSRPARSRLWEYVFFVDFEGHVNDPLVSAAIEGLGKQCSSLKVLGSYPTAT